MANDTMQGRHPSAHTDPENIAGLARLATLTRPREQPKHAHTRLKKRPT